MTPLIDGQLHHFESRGLYDGVSLLWDRESGTWWHHITGEALSGPLVGHSLPVYNLLHLTVEAALAAYPEIQLAMSDRPIRAARDELSELNERVRELSGQFRATMSEEDTRKPTMDIGIGVWSDAAQKYYSMKDVRAAGNALVDELGGRPLVVYLDVETYTLLAMYAEAAGAEWDGDTLRLDTGESLRRGVLADASGARLEIERPLQVFTRWYGFALTFPETEVYEP